MNITYKIPVLKDSVLWQHQLFSDLTEANLTGARSYAVCPNSHTQGTLFENTIMPDGTIKSDIWV